MSQHASANPVPPWSHLANANSQASSSVPGLNPQNLLSAQSSFEYNQTAIPGLSFAGSAVSLPTDAPASSQTTGQGQTVQQHNASTKTNTTGPPLYQATTSANIHAPIEMEDDAMEEGELSESAFEDLYEPYLEPGEEKNAGRTTQQEPTDDEDYDPGNPDSPTVLHTGQTASPVQNPSAESQEGKSLCSSLIVHVEAHLVPSVRERSRSYSPYLSPHEVEPESPATAQAVESNQTESIPAGSGKLDSLLDAKKKAQAAILRLWPLEVRFQDYVDEGIDKEVVHSLFAGLGLDTRSARTNHNNQPQVHPSPKADMPATEATQPTMSAQAPKSTATTVAEASQPTQAVTAEERKDRIARRLMAAKAAKQASPGESTQNATAGAARPSAAPGPPTTSQTNTPPTEPSQKKAEKERLLQEKLAKLQQSRALRAQKASEKAGAAAAPHEQSSHVRPDDQATLPSTTHHPATQTSTAQEVDSTEGAPSSTQPALPIPGLFLSSSGSPLVNPRKRPVASDLNESSAAPPYKRTFNQHYVEQPLIINVSDGSDDEDVEMDLSSPIDGPTSEYPPTNQAPPGSSTLRDQLPLTDKQTRHSLGRPASRTSNGTGAKDHDNAKLGHLTQNISQLKQKIAELQRQKSAKAASKESPTQSSTGTPAADTQQPPTATTAPSRAQSASSSTVLRESPVPAEPDVQRVLPKVSRTASSSRPDRREQIRVFSNKLPTLDSSIATIVAKERLLESQLKRAREEADNLRSQRDFTRQRLEELQAEDNASPEPEPEQVQVPNGQQQSSDFGPPPSGVREDQSAQAPPLQPSPHNESPTDSPADAGIVASAEMPVPVPDSSRSQDADMSPTPMQPAVSPDETEKMVGLVEDAAMDESSSAEEPQQPGGPSSQLSTDDAMHIDTALNGDRTDNPPEPSTEHEAEARGLQAEILSPALADDSTPPILANADSQESGSESADLPGHISKGVSDAADDELELPQQVYNGRSTEPATNLASEDTTGMPSRTDFVPYESVLKGFLSYRFHPNFRKDVAGGLKSPTYSNKINPQVQFCLDFLLGTCTRGASCKYQHIDAVGISGKCSDFSNSD